MIEINIKVVEKRLLIKEEGRFSVFEIDNVMK
jgi:hypothetical protein